MISSDNVDLGIGATTAINKCTITQALEVRKQNARKCLIHLVEKLKERSPLLYKYTHIACLSPNQNKFFQLIFLVNCVYYSVNKTGLVCYVQIVLKLHTNYL